MGHHHHKSRHHKHEKHEKHGKRGRRGKRGKDGFDGLPGATGPTGATGANGTNGTNGTSGASGVVQSASFVLKEDISVTDSQNTHTFFPIVQAKLSIVTSQPASKLLIWMTVSSSNNTPGATNFFRVVVDGVQQEAAAASLYNSSPVVGGASIAFLISAPAKILHMPYVIQVEWKASGTTTAFVRPVAANDSEHLDLMAMEVLS